MISSRVCFDMRGALAGIGGAGVEYFGVWAVAAGAGGWSCDLSGVGVLSADKDRHGQKNGKEQEGRDVKTLHKTPQGHLRSL